MITLPLVWLVSVLTTIAAFALAQDTRMPFQARLFLCIFLLTLASIGLLLGFRLSFDVPWAAWLQPLVAVMVAPSAYLGFSALTQDLGLNWRRTLLLRWAPVAVAQLAILANVPVSADVFVLGINSIYLVLIARLLRRQPDDFVHVAPHALIIVRSAIKATVVLLGMMVATDLSIVAASLFAGDAYILTFLTGVSGLFTAFVFVVALIGAPMLLQVTKGEATKVEGPTENDHATRAALDALMNDTHLYTDSNLTLARVARRLSIPVRDVSNAINRTTGENFSRYINGFRIRHAQEALRKTELSVTEVMFEAGFVSKSSFNTEFRRVTGKTPSQFRAETATT
ncbi:L-rhamnose operon regulatory protein RhaS [Thalassovita gelatinovora]|uniref:L-rhamnose operon regulatory protein RhaS n=1 Tax=Thalassovita gelatinovora TaxID=53501 RepID=A0A0P1FWM5_THAGE|nr:AraC family transcriptional regulator [Thalassovita gelatinovora]QIZ82237.1 helix-turn-helix transcriptional regulator [Thalassovita gelatinovora]CUH63760.1 L-rhamnose operon regulatory protein RhaS [Thalassovita gelatinovora]SEQ98095.1 transcriptional regulator, AraC family [Thalassovita gelatinovora]